MTQNDVVAQTTKMQDDLREALHEAHARPPMPIAAPCRILQMCFRGSDEKIDALFATATGVAIQSGPRHIIAKFGNKKIKLERHTEFTSMMIVEDNIEPDANAHFGPPDSFLFAGLEMLVQTDIIIFSTPKALVKNLPQQARVYGGTLAGGLEIRTTLVPNNDGRISFYGHSPKTGPDETGRRLQRLIELETYRIFSLIGLPVARRASVEVKAIEDKLTDLTTRLKEDRAQTAEASEAMFDELSALSADASAVVAQTRFRFAASRAYFDLVNQRMTSLSEQKAGDVGTLSGFIAARLEPAIATIESTGRRQVVLSEDISRALTMLRTKVELNLNRANQKLLQSMDQRHQQHVKIAQAVESLSVVAITYYSVGLLAYVFKGLDKITGIEGFSIIATAVTAPLVFLFVWVSLRKVRQKLDL